MNLEFIKLKEEIYLCIEEMPKINYYFESKHAFHASKKYFIELGNELFDTKKWNQLNTSLWI